VRRDRPSGRSPSRWRRHGGSGHQLRTEGLPPASAAGMYTADLDRHGTGSLSRQRTSSSMSVAPQEPPPMHAACILVLLPVQGVGFSLLVPSPAATLCVSGAEV